MNCQIISKRLVSSALQANANFTSTSNQLFFINCNKCIKKRLYSQSTTTTTGPVLTSATTPNVTKKTSPPTTVKKRKSVNIDSIGTWDSTTDLPLLIDSSIFKGTLIPSITTRNIGVSSVKGRRPTQEDFYSFGQLGTKGEILYLGIYDGHGGSNCSRFCAKQIPKHISHWLLSRPDIDLTSIIHHTFLEVNNAFSRWFTLNRKEQEITSSGSTATVCLLDRNSGLVVGHVGDSRAIICRSGEARKLTTDHIPSLITEQTRIEKSGGKVSRTRVNDRLAMTRSLGDLELKPYGVTAEPEIRSWEINHGRDAFLVLTSDGINNVMTDAEIIEIIKQATDPTEAAHLLSEIAIQYSSEDNSTALVCPLGSWGKFSAAATIFHSFGKSFTSSSRFS